MTIIRILMKSRTVQAWMLMAAIALVLISLGIQADLNKSEWSGWAQAVGAFVAIMASGWIASSQARWQFQASLQLQKAEQSRQAHQMAEAAEVIARRVVKAFDSILTDFADDRTTFHIIAGGFTNFDRNLLSEMRANLEAIPLHEMMSSRVVEQLILMKSTVRQASEKIEAALTGQRSMDANDFEEFFESLNDMRVRLDTCLIQIQIVKRSVQAEISDLSNI